MKAPEWVQYENVNKNLLYFDWQSLGLSYHHRKPYLND